jgi:RNA binding exosome subunit
MIPKIAKVTVSAIVHATEDPDKIVSAMQGIDPQTDARLERRKASGHYGNEIQTARLTISNRSRTEDFLVRFWGRLALVDRREIIDNLQSYLDESGPLHIRIDKQEAVNGKIVLGQAEPIRIEISFDLQGIPNKTTATLIRKSLEELAL